MIRASGAAKVQMDGLSRCLPAEDQPAVADDPWAIDEALKWLK